MGSKEQKVFIREKLRKHNLYLKNHPEGERFKVIDLVNLRIEDCSLEFADLRGTQLAQTTFTNVNFRSADFSGLTASSAVFENCDFGFAKFWNFDTSECTFIRCKYLGTVSWRESL